MDFGLLEGFHAKLLDVVHRNEAYWRTYDYLLERKKTKLHVLAYVTSGSGMLQIGEKKQELKPGMLFQVWPGNYLKITTGAADLLSFYSVHFWYGVVRWQGMQGMWHPGEGPLPFSECMKVSAGTDMYNSFADLFKTWSAKEASRVWEANIRFLHIIKTAVDCSVMQRSAEEASGARAVREALAYIKLHYKEPLTREKIARHVSLSPAYFSSLFKSHTGYTPVEYIHRLRLDRARQLLRTTDLSVREVAEQVGFADSFYFTRLFTKDTGISPREYRQA
jgi:AraC-like DNA-binding protein